MKKTQNFKTILATLLLLTTLGCSQKGFEADSAALIGGSDSNGSQGTTPVVTNPIDQVNLKSRIDDQSNQSGTNGAVAFDFDKVRGEFIVMIPMPAGIMFSASGSIAKYPDITYGPMFDSSGKMKMAIRIPIKYVLKGVQIGNPAALPSGEALPPMPAGQGELPGLALTFPQHNNMQIHLYIGINAIGVFVTLPQNAALPIPFNLTFPLKNQDKTRTFGYLTYVSAKNNHPAGLFIGVGIPAEFARILQDYFDL